MVASQRCLERARPTPFDAHQFEGRPPHKTQPRASAPPTAPKRASGLLDAGPLPHLEHHRRPHPRPLELGYIPTPLLTHQDNLGSYHYRAVDRNYLRPHAMAKYRKARRAFTAGVDANLALDSGACGNASDVRPPFATA